MTDSPKDTENVDIYRFGIFVLDPARRELRKEGQTVEIEPRAFDVLVYLARHHDRAVDKDELQDVVWPGMIVTETALTRAVMKARKAVEDDANAQTVIKTLHGHGYRFIASLASATEEGITVAEASPGTAAQVDQQKKLSGRGWSLRSTGLTVAAIVVAIALAWLILRTPSRSGLSQG